MRCDFWDLPRKKHLLSSVEALPKDILCPLGLNKEVCGPQWQQPLVAFKYSLPFFLGIRMIQFPAGHIRVQHGSVSQCPLQPPYVTKFQLRRWKQKDCVVLPMNLLTRKEASLSHVPSSCLECRCNGWSFCSSFGP